MGRFTFYCPLTGEAQTFSNVQPGATPTPFYSARLTAQEIDIYEAVQRRRFQPNEDEPLWRPSFQRHPHQVPGQ